jgi:hypothetical protein
VVLIVLTYCQAFIPSNLDSNIVFPDEPNTPRWVVGRGQNVYWKECNVIVVGKDNEGQYKETHLPYRNGQGTVPMGIELYLSGTGGRVKEQ